MRRWFLTLALCLSPAVAAADTVTDSVIDQLRAQGYSRFTVERTLLGRIRVEAVGSARWREIVFNPQTGEILRDYSEALDRRDRAALPRLLVDADEERTGSDEDRWDRDDEDDDRSGRGGGDEDEDRDRSGRGGGDEEDDDDEDDDEDDDDDEDEDDDDKDDDDDDDD